MPQDGRPLGAPARLRSGRQNPRTRTASGASDEAGSGRLCRTCGHVGCCDSSPNKHATKHFHATGHPIIEGYDPPEGWGWCYIDEVFFDLSDRATPQRVL